VLYVLKTNSPASVAERGFVPVPMVNEIAVPPTYDPEGPKGSVKVIRFADMVQEVGLSPPEIEVIEQGSLSVSANELSVGN